MGRPRKTGNAVDTEVAIRGCALAWFGRHGFETASLADIAKAAGVTRPTLLYYFESKEKLYAAVVQEAFTQLATMLLGSMMGGGTLHSRARRMVRRFVEFVEDNPHLAKLLVREVIDERGPGCRIIVEQGLPILEMVEAFLTDAGRVAPDQRSLLREVLLQITTSVMLKSASGAMRDTFWGKRARTKELATLLIEGLLGPEAPRAAAAPKAAATRVERSTR
jgi:AcrR family transcriptional regulator